MPSMLRTRQLQLAPDDAARLAAATAPPSPAAPTTVSRASRTDYETPLAGVTHGRTQPRTEIGEESALDRAPTAATARWGQAPPELEGRTPAPPSRQSPPSTPGVPPAPVSSVDLTMDEQRLPQSGRLPAPLDARPGPRLGGDATVPASGRLDGSSTRSADLARARAPEGNRSLLLVGACFLAGAVAMAAVAYKLGLVGGHVADPRSASASTTASGPGARRSRSCSRPPPQAATTSDAPIPAARGAHPSRDHRRGGGGLRQGLGRRLERATAGGPADRPRRARRRGRRSRPGSRERGSRSRGQGSRPGPR